MGIALSFQWKTETDEGEALGHAWTWDEDDPEQMTLEIVGWMSISEAKALADERGYKLYADEF